MELMIVLIFALVLIILLLKNKSTNGDKESNLNIKNNKHNDDYEVWLDIFKKEKSNVKEFDLFGTKAAIVWNDGDLEAVVICITAFSNQKPTTKKWDYFEFNVKEKYWTGKIPRGSVSRIREELIKLGLHT